MTDQQPGSPRARLQALQAIPERQRTDAEWDELNELEIMLASSNRQGAQDPNNPRGNPQQQGGQNRPGRQQQGRGGGRHHGQRPPKRHGR